MTTLREEREAATANIVKAINLLPGPRSSPKLYGEGYRAGFDDALGPYGDYEVVEVRVDRDGAWLPPGHRNYALIDPEHHIKLLVPPNCGSGIKSVETPGDGWRREMECQYEDDLPDDPRDQRIAELEGERARAMRLLEHFISLWLKKEEGK